jgi:GT2 family glycosyltransferase
LESKVIILILSYNGKYLLKDSISSYLANDYPNFEVVVIDNGSSDNTKEWVEKNYPDVFVLRTEINLGYSGGFNFGLDYAFNKKQADYVLITNNDVKADPKVISELVIVAETDQMIGFVTGKVYYFDKPDTLQTVGYKEDSLRWIGGHIGGKEQDNGQFDQDVERFMSDDIFILVKNTVFEAVGGYNTLFKFQGEQADWQARAKKVGFKIYYAHKAKIWHKESMTIGRNSKFKLFFDVRNFLILRFIHKDEYFLKVYFKWYLSAVVLKPVFKNLIKFRFGICYTILRGFFSAMKYIFKNRLFKFSYLF